MWLAAGGAPHVPWLDSGDWPADGAGDWSPPRVAGDELALLLYTSGSTGAPKGVMVSRAGLAAQMTVFRQLAELPDGANVVTWMPVYHALGAAGTVLMSQYIGGSCTLLTPDDFVAEPVRWLRAISQTPGPVFSCGPNFAYERCVERVTPQQRAELDLSNWYSAFNAAERIQRRTIERFTAAFAPHGFDPSAWFPGYGLTEVTLGVAGRRGAQPLTLSVDAAALEQARVRPVPAGTERAVDLVGCGAPHPRVELLVVDPEQRTVRADDEVGEVWIAGDVVNQGYWRRPAETAETFGGHLADGTGPFLRTGDLAFRHGEDIVVCGRIKELIIIRGRNIYPQDVEATARRAHEALTSAPAAAFSVDAEAGERLVIVQSVAGTADPAVLREIASEVRRVVTSEHEVDVEVVLVPPDQVPMTGSGKIRRPAARRSYLDGRLTTLFVLDRGTAPGTAESPAAQPLRAMVTALPEELRRRTVTAELRRRVAAVLDCSPESVPGDRPLLACGLESLRMVELRYGLNQDFGIALPMADFLRGSLVDVVCAVLHQLDGDPGNAIEWPELVADPGHRYEPFPLTEIQHGYLVGRSSVYDLGGTSIHLYTEYDCPDLDIGRLCRALDALVARHEMLRAIVSSDGNQRILPEVPPVPVREYDLRGAPAGELASHLERVREELGHQVLPLDTWPMFDVRVTWTGGSRAQVHVSMDLLVADVASVRLFFLELGDLYRNPDAVLPPLPVSFRDYVLAAARIRDTEAYQRSREYWLDRVDTLPPNPRLPVVGLPPDQHKPLRVRRTGTLDSQRWARIRQRAAALGITPSAVQLAAYATVLATWSRSSRFTIDVPLFNRHPLHPAINQIIGDFTSVTLLEVDLRPGGGVAGLAERIQRQLWQDLDHRYFSGVEVIREISRRRGVPAGSFAGIVFASAREQGRDQAFQQGDVGANWLGRTVCAVSQTPQVLLDHQVYEDRGALSYKWDAVEAMFPPGVVDEMVAAYGRLLHALADDDRSWERTDLDLLPPAQAELIARANDTAGPLPDEHLFTAIVEHARRYPDRPAVFAGDRVLTYGALYRHACRLGRRLRDLGARPNQPVAVAADKSVEQVIAVLAAQLSGAAYLPLDPELPEARQWDLLRLAGARLVLTGPGGAGRGWPAGIIEVPVDTAASDTAASDTVGDGPDAAPLEPVQATTDLAYVLYTSGSTGIPKGVALTHRAVVNTLTDFAERCGLGPDDRALGLSSLSFDLSVGDLFGVLRAGGALVLPGRSALRDPAVWLELMAAHRVTVWNSVPALMEMLVEHCAGLTEPHPGTAGVRLVWLSGDWIPVSLPERIRATCPAARVVASGGPTETAIWCVAHDVTPEDGERESIPYGRPMRNHTIHILNDRLDRCPVWVPGEMFIGGAGLAEGYWRDPERTAASFLTHPRTGARLYRSGDLGRWLPSGEIEILGREDFQVKVRGHRIELGEVESALARQPGVRAAAVTTVGDPHRPHHLAAVVVPDATARPEAGQVGTTTQHDAYDEALGDVLTDPVARLEFKARRPGVRSDLTGPAHPLPAPPSAAPARRSVRSFVDGPVPLAALGALLEPLRTLDSGVLPRHRYASAGALYPVQTYLYVPEGRVDALPGGTYYHDADRHRLVAVHPGARLGDDIHVPDNHDTFASAAFSVFLVAQRHAVEPLYGRLARDFCLVEAGLIAQLLDDAAVAHGLGLCQVGFVRNTPGLRGALALDDGHEVLHALLGGRPAEPAGGSPPGTGFVEDLRRRLGALLPEYLVPATYVMVDQLPRTARGKLDRAALRQVAADSPAGDDHAGAHEAVSDTERTILDVFHAELGSPHIHPLDRFIEIGADSVTIVRIHRRLRTELQVDFPLMAMFEHPSIRRLAAHLSGTGAERTAAQEGRDRARRRTSRRRPPRPA
ncbi:MAG: hypothetical protein AUG44_20025 [Actinobacteria bacterium 13_1_20CM_3_71_11]|nr:MAG: hypothetical protein AUG44_20025 [Actinobacteria bacterium 13_1_20CM_3_71_11]